MLGVELIQKQKNQTNIPTGKASQSCRHGLQILPKVSHPVFFRMSLNVHASIQRTCHSTSDVP